MRISDWSSDVCSADLARLLGDREDMLVVAGLGSAIWDAEAAGETPLNFYMLGAMGSVASTALGLALAQPERRVLDRKRGVAGKSVAVRVAIGGRRIITKKTLK